MAVFKSIYKIAGYGMLLTSLAVGSVELYNKYIKNKDETLAVEYGYYKYPSQLEIRIENISGTDIAFLVDEASGRKEPIMEGFQLGSADYRLKGLVDEGAAKVVHAGEQIVEWVNGDE